jgi:hypothetical protein
VTQILLDRYHFNWTFVDCIYLVELEIKDTTDTDKSASYLELHLEIDSKGRLRTKLYDKRDDFNRSDDFNFTNRNPWFSSFLVCSNPLSRKLLGTTSSGIWLRDIYSIYWCCLGVVTVTNDHGYVPLVVNTSLSFPHS